MLPLREIISFEMPRLKERLQKILKCDLRGRLVRPLIDEYHATGSFAPEWDKRDGAGLEVPSGVYFARLIVSGSGIENVTCQKAVLIK